MNIISLPTRPSMILTADEAWDIEEREFARHGSLYIEVRVVEAPADEPFDDRAELALYEVIYTSEHVLLGMVPWRGFSEHILSQHMTRADAVLGLGEEIDLLKKALRKPVLNQYGDEVGAA